MKIICDLLTTLKGASPRCIIVVSSVLRNLCKTALEGRHGTSLNKILRYAVVHEYVHIDRFVIQSTVASHFRPLAREGSVVVPGGVDSIQAEYLEQCRMTGFQDTLVQEAEHANAAP